MITFHAILTDETGVGEFGVTLDAKNKTEAWDQLAEDYPECRVTQVLSLAEIAERQAEREARLYDDDPYYGDEYDY